jgi:hypothetical protein
MVQGSKVARALGVQFGWWPGCESPPCKKIFLIRHLVDAVTSGFVYHASGRECWLDHNGEPNPGYAGAGCYGVAESAWGHGGNPWGCHSQIDGQNLCAYLGDGNIKMQARVDKYVDYAFEKWYRRVISVMADPSVPRICMGEVMALQNTSFLDAALDIVRAPKALQLKLDKGHVTKGIVSPCARMEIRAEVERAMSKYKADVSLGCSPDAEALKALSLNTKLGSLPSQTDLFDQLD